MNRLLLKVKVKVAGGVEGQWTNDVWVDGYVLPGRFELALTNRIEARQVDDDDWTVTHVNTGGALGPTRLSLDKAGELLTRLYALPVPWDGDFFSVVCNGSVIYPVIREYLTDEEIEEREA